MEWLDDGDDWQCVRARDAEDAAAKYAERYDCDGGEYAIVSGKSDAIVLVRADGDETPLRFRIEAEAVPQYWARHIKPQSVG